MPRWITGVPRQSARVIGITAMEKVGAARGANGSEPAYRFLSLPATPPFGGICAFLGLRRKTLWKGMFWLPRAPPERRQRMVAAPPYQEMRGQRQQMRSNEGAGRSMVGAWTRAC